MYSSNIKPMAGEVHPRGEHSELYETHKELLNECVELWDTRAFWEDEVWDQVGESIFRNFYDAAYPHEEDPHGWLHQISDYNLQSPTGILQAIEDLSELMCGCHQSHCSFVERFRHFNDQWEKWRCAAETRWDDLSEQEQENWTSWSDEDHAVIMDGVDLISKFKIEPQARYPHELPFH